MAKSSPPAKKSKRETPAKPAPRANGKPAKAAAKARVPDKPEKKAAEKKPEKKARPDLSDKVTHLIAEEMAIEEAELTPAASFREDFNLDEIDIAELLMQAEATFGLNPFSEADWESCETVADFIQLVEKRVAAKRAKK